MLCGDIRTEMVEYELCVLTWVISHVGHVNNTGPHSEWRSGSTLYIVQVPLDNALVLSNHCEYRHK